MGLRGDAPTQLRSNDDAERRAGAVQCEEIVRKTSSVWPSDSLPHVRSGAWLERTPNNATVRARSVIRNRRPARELPAREPPKFEPLAAIDSRSAPDLTRSLADVIQ